MPQVAPPSGTGLRAVRAVVLGGAALAVLLAVLDLASTRVPWAPQWGEPGHPVREYFDVAREQNLPTWVSVGLLLLSAAVAVSVALLARAARDPAAGPWAVFGVICAALSLDDMTLLHERLGGLGRSLGGGTGLTYAAWVLPGLVVAVVVIVAVALLACRTTRATRRLLVTGLAALLLGAFGLEAVGNAVLEDQGFGRTYAWFLAIEEFVETLGAVLLLAGALSALQIDRTDDGVRVRLRRPPPNAQTAR